MQHTPSTASSQDRQSSRSYPVSHLSADVVLNSLHSHNYKLTDELSLSCHRTSLQIDSLQVLLQSRSIIACKCISKLARSWLPTASSEFTRSRPPSASPNSLDYGLQVSTILASKCISKLARLRPPSASLGSLYRSLQVYLQTRSITACKYIFNDRRRVYGDTGVTEVDRVTGSIYSADPRVDRHYLISISSYHTMQIHTLSSREGPRNCVDPHSRVVSDLFTFLRSSSLM